MDRMDLTQIISANEVHIPNICLLCLETTNNLLEISASDEQFICEECWKKVKSFDDFYNFVKCNHQEKCTNTESIDVYKHEPVIEIIDVSNDSDEHVVDEVVTVEDCASNSSNDRQSQLKRTATLPNTEPSPKRCSTDSDSSLLSKYFSMKCELCDDALSYQDFNKHYKEAHDLEKGYLICCNKKFYQLPHMLQHCRWHSNLDFDLKCSKCTKTFANKNRLRYHLNCSHEPKVISSDNCAKPKVFSSDDCDKTFSKRHYRSVRQKKGNSSKTTNPEEIEKEHEMIRNRFLMQCDLCGDPFSTFHDAELHHLNKHNQPGYLCCCGRKFFKITSAVQHCVWHVDPESFKPNGRYA